MWEDADASGFSIDAEHTGGALVVGVDGAVAIGISPIDGIKAVVSHFNGNGDEDVLVACDHRYVSLCSADVYTLQSRYFGTRFGLASHATTGTHAFLHGLPIGVERQGKTLHFVEGGFTVMVQRFAHVTVPAVGSNCHHGIFAIAQQFCLERCGTGHLAAIAQHDVLLGFGHFLPADNLSADICYGCERLVGIRAHHHLHRCWLTVVEYHFDGMSALEIGWEERIGFHAVEFERLQVVAEARDGHIEHGVAVLEIRKMTFGLERLGHKGTEADAAHFVVDAEVDVGYDGKVGGYAPKLTRRIDGQTLLVAVVDYHVLEVGERHGSQAVDRRDGMEHAFLITCLGLGLHPVALREGPHAVVMVGILVLEVGVEVGCAEGFAHHALADALLAVEVGDVPKDGKRLTEDFHLRMLYKVVATIEVDGIEATILHPEVAVHAFAQVIGPTIVLAAPRGLSFEATDLGQDAQRTVVYGGCSHGFALIDVGRLCPCGIFLLAPVEPRCLAVHQFGLWVVGHHAVILDGCHDDGEDAVEPFLVACYKIHLPGGEYPRGAVGRTGPGATCTGVLDDAVVGIDLGKERLAAHFGIQLGQGMENGIGHVARPHATPEDACAIGRIGFDGEFALLQAHVEEGVVDGERRGVVGQVTDVALQGPVLAVDARIDVGHEVGRRACPLVAIVAGDVGGTVGLGLEAALRELVAPPLVLRGLVDGLCLGGKGK